jgi:hypothetical protein
VWNDPTVDWTSVDLAVIRSCWDYTACRAEFVAWARSVPRLANPADVIAWNTDKRYLREIASAGIPVVPTTWLAPDEHWSAARTGEWVVKPAVSVAALDSGRYLMSEPSQRRMATAHVRRLQDTGRAVMVQPYLDAVDTDGEMALIYLRGAFSHAVRKDAVLHGPDTGMDRRFTEDGYRIRRRQPTQEQLELAESVLGAVPGGSDRLLYARVDLIPGPAGHALLSELELTEPSLFLARAPGSIDRFANAINSWMHPRVAASYPSA